MPRGYISHPLSEINITNLVDVALTLLIIFIMVAPLMQHGVDVELPQVTSKGLDLRKEHVVTIDHKKKVYLDDKAVNLDELSGRLKSLAVESPGKTVYFRADRRLDVGFAVEVIGIIKNAGIENLGIVTEPGKMK